MATVDIGTIAGISIGATAPSNQAIIWYDTTDGLHKSYNQSLGEWVPMSQAIVAEIADFNDLINKANLPGGLPIGAFYHVVKRDSDANWNTMVWVVGSTRVQYVDKQNNIIVEDLAGQGTTTQYVASTNYFFDNVVATFDAATSKLNFQFQSVTDNPAMTDVLYGMRMVGENATLVKRTIQSLISKSPKNSLAFVDGLYFNFSAAMKGVIVSEQTDDTTVIGYKQYTADYAAMDKVFKDVQDIVRDWQNNSREMIFTSKLIEVNPVTATVATPQDLTTQDDLKTALNKIQGWYNRLKLATGMTLSSDYVKAPSKTRYPQGGDTVQQAIAILHKFVEDFDGKATNVVVGGSEGDFPASPNPSYQIKPTDSLYQAVAKIVNNLASLFGGGVSYAAYLADNLVRTQSIRPKAVNSLKISDELHDAIFCHTYNPVDWSGDDTTNFMLEPGCMFDAINSPLTLIDPVLSEADVFPHKMWDTYVHMKSNQTFKAPTGSALGITVSAVYTNQLGSGDRKLVHVRFIPAARTPTTGFFFVTTYLFSSQA